MGTLSLISFLCSIFILFSVVAADSEDGYIFTCSRSLKTGATNQMQLRRYGNLEAGNFRIKITYVNSKSETVVAKEQVFDIEKDDDETLLEVFLEPITDKYAHSEQITINGTFADYVIGGTESVSFSSSRNDIVFIQTDKPLYKEGQTVKFRVLRVDKTLRPLVKDQANIWVEDTAGTRLFQWKNVSLERGMKQFEFPLADEPELGKWKISASFQGETTTTNFEIKEYVLPTFDVKITLPPFVLSSANEIPIKVCAKYTYGKPVEGTLRLNISRERYGYRNEKIPVIEYEGEIKGCSEYTINVSVVGAESYNRRRRIQVVASVEESGTGTERNNTEYIHRHTSPFNLNFNQHQKQFFKPGLPYNGKLFVKYPDGSPNFGEVIQICYTVTKERIVLDDKWKATRTVKYCQNYTSDEDGVIEYVIPRQNTDLTEINIEAKSLKSVENFMNQPQTSMSLSPFHSPSGSFIQLQQVQENLICGTKNRVKVLFTSKNDNDYTFYYQVLSQGKVVDTGTVKKAFSVSEDVADKYEDKSKTIDDVEIQTIPPVDQARKIDAAESEKEECKSAKEARYVPPVGEFDIELDIDPSWSPSFHLLVYYIREDRETVADSQKFNVEKCFRNQVKLQFGDDIKQPGTKTSITVTSSPNSLCGIKVVDKSVTLMKSDDQLTTDKVFRVLESVDIDMDHRINHCTEEIRQPGLSASSSTRSYPLEAWKSSYEDSLAAFENAGFLVISDMILFTRPCVYDISYEMDVINVRRRYPVRISPQLSAPTPEKKEFATKSVVDVRDYFPETWLFDLKLTEEDGIFIAKEKLPHTITEWIGSAVCINDEDGLGLSNTASLKGFQAFFLSMTLPYSVIRGESFWITISVFSYVEDPLPIAVALDDLEGFEIVSESINGMICVQPGSSVNLKVQLKGIALGINNITVRAESAQNSAVCGNDGNSKAIAKDAIRKSVIVEAEGWPVEEIESVLFCPKDEENGVYKNTLILNEPEDVVPDSSRAYLDVTGNVLGKSLDNLENLVTLPTGCGEQNMVKFAPNIVAMKMLISTNQLTEKTKERIIKNLNAGVQRQLNYKHPDGSYSAFGTRDKEGSMFLTAFVLRYFSEASKYITMDNSTITQMQDWIISKQKADGCFPDVGKIFHRELQGGVKDKSEITITGYVLTSLLISGYKRQEVLVKALICLINSEDTSLYANFLYAYAEALAGEGERARRRIESVKKRAIAKGNVIYYHDLNTTKSQAIETSSYAILSILNSGGTASDALPIVQYLMQNMNPQGGFYSTQDTCVGLEALGQFSEMTFKDPVDISINVAGGMEKDIQISENEKLLVRRYKVKEVPSTIKIEASGSGCAVLQQIFRYNSKTSPKKRSFNLKAVGKCSDDDCKRATISLSFSYAPNGKKTGMALLEIKMITGMSPIKESLPKLFEDKKSKIMRYDVEANTVVFYFNEIQNNDINMSFEVEKIVEVENAQPGTVKLYDYYNRDLSSSTSYTFL